jgi:hypothetical protein
LADPGDVAEREFLKEFNDYDQTVDVVSCWQAFCHFRLKSAHFYRFGKFRTTDGSDLTPDFGLAESADGANAHSGSLICDIKKFPNPYPVGADTKQQEVAYQIFGASVEDIFKYAVPLKYVSDRDSLPKLVFSEHDIVLLTPSEIVDPVYTYLASKIESKPFNVGRPLVLVEYFYSQGEQLERYVFKWKQGEANSPFSDTVLREQMVTKGLPLVVYPKHFLEYKIRYVLCNDPAPTIYLLVFLWLEVFLKTLSPDQIESWQTTSSTRAIEIELSVDQVHSKLETEYSAPFSKNDVRRALDKLVELKRAAVKDRDKEVYVIQFYNIAGRVFRDFPGEQDGLGHKAKFKEYSRVFARLLAKKEIEPPPPRKRIGFRRGRPPKDYPRLPFPE